MEEDLRRINDNLLNDTGAGTNVNRVSHPTFGGGAGGGGAGFSSQQIDDLRREKNELKIEYDKVLRMMRENGQYDVYMLRKENERLSKTVKINLFYLSNSIL